MKGLFLTLFLALLSISVYVKAEAYPLNDAARSQNFKLVDKLLSSGINPNESNQSGSTALSGVVGMCGEDDLYSLNITLSLLEHGAAINQANDQGLTPVSHAAFMGCAANVSYLIEHGADIFLRTTTGTTPLMNAVMSQNIETIKVLLKAGANPVVKSRKGYDAFYIANNFGNDEITELLEYYREINSSNYVYNYMDCSESKYNFEGIKSIDGTITKCYDKPSVKDEESSLTELFNHKSFNIFVSFLLTWTIILLPVLLLKRFSKISPTRVEAGVFVFILFFVNHIIFTALESQSRSHAAISIGAMLSYIILRMRIKKDLADSSSEASTPPNQGWGKKIISSPAPQANVIRGKPLSKNKKLLISFSVFWLVWVSVRTFYSFEFLGFDFYEWDEDAYFLNLLVPPCLVVMIYSIFDWVKSGRAVEDDG